MKQLKHLLVTNKLAKILEIICIFLAAYLIIKTFSRHDSDRLIYNQIVVWIANIVMLVLVWTGLKIRGESWQDFGLTFGKITFRGAGMVFLKSLLVFALAMTGFIIGSVITANITGVPENPDMSGYAFLEDNLFMLLISLAGVYIVSSFGEEVIYRGFLINRISQLLSGSKAGVWIAVLLSAIIFGLVHYSWGTAGIVQTAFMGLALGICYILFKRRLWILILAHAYMDTILMVQMYMASN